MLEYHSQISTEKGFPGNLISCQASFEILNGHDCIIARCQIIIKIFQFTIDINQEWVHQLNKMIKINDLKCKNLP